MYQHTHQGEEVDDEISISAESEERSTAEVLVGLKHLTVLQIKPHEQHIYIYGLDYMYMFLQQLYKYVSKNMTPTSPPIT